MWMKMTFRWYGEQFDSIPLSYIKQIPGIYGVVPTLSDVPAGELWPREKIWALYELVSKHKLRMEVIESVNVHEDIKLGKDSKDIYVGNYIQTIRNLSEVGVKVICYNFMPVFDWTRSDMYYRLDDDSEALCYDYHVIDAIKDPQKMADDIKENSNGYHLPGWEPERLADLSEQFEAYKAVDHETLFQNLVYFLNKIMPVCEECDIKMAIHPDDPPWDIFGLPRIITGKESIDRLMNAVDTPYNGITLCSGSLGADRTNDIPAMIRYFGEKGRVHFGHVRNLKIIEDRFFHETSHLSSDGDIDIYEVMKAYHDIGFEGYIRPDHGRMIWGEKGRPGYGLYDRALGIAYLNGLAEAISKGAGSTRRAPVWSA
jgi:mannonate dehydratase